MAIKRKRVSKKSKLSWRKHTKVADIEEFLNDQRDEERLGSTLSTVADSDLFVIDTKSDQDQLPPSRSRRKLRAQRPLRGFAALLPHTEVPDPIKKRNRVRTPEERKNELVKLKEQENIKNGVLKAKQITAIAERRLYEIKKEKKEKRGEFSKDIWSDSREFPIENDPWAEPVTKVHNLRNTGVAVKRVARDLTKKKSVLPAVELPHPGMSYNPSFKDHQELLKAVADEETKVIKKEEHIQRVTRDMFRRVSEGQKQSEWIVEMSQGINPEETQVKEEIDDLDRISVNPPVKNKKKTVQQRRKQREQLDLQKQRKTTKIEKKKVGDIQKIRILKKTLEKTEEKQAKLRELRKKRVEKKALQPKVLSSTKYEDLGPDFQMGQDIVGNLRGLKKEGNLLSDRFNSLQKRNILEPRKRAHIKKGKVKKFVKPGHKDDWEKTVARNSNLVPKGK